MAALPFDVAARVIQQREKFERRLVDRNRERQNVAPTGGCRSVLAEPLVQLRKADERHQGALGEVERLFERRPFALVILELPLCGREVEPQLAGFWRDLAGALEVRRGRLRIAGTQRLHAQPVCFCRLVGPHDGHVAPRRRPRHLFRWPM